MIGKLSALVVGVGVIACGLLGIRQARIHAGHEMADVQRRIARHDRELWTLRAEIARRVTPEKAEDMGKQLGPLVGISPERIAELVRAEAAAAEASALTRADADDRSTPR